MSSKEKFRHCLEVLRINLLFILLIIPLSGCVIVSSEGSAPSKQTVRKLSDLNGEYSNMAEGNGQLELSTLVLGNYNPNADRIRVLAKDERTLVITLVQGNNDLSTNQVQLFEKFKKDGRSLIAYEYSGNGNESGNGSGIFSFSGHLWRSGKLYIAINGDVIYYETSSGAGVGGISWMMIPIAGHTSKGYTFKKLK